MTKKQKKKLTKKQIKMAQEELGTQLEEILNKDAKKDLEKKHKSIKKILEEEKNTTLKDVYTTTEKYLHVNDKNRIDLILATVLSNQLEGTPIWMFIVGNSGDWKSAFARSLEGIENIKKIDQLTKNTLATGMKDTWDLGSELQNNSTILLFPDLASLTSMNTDEKNAIWGQFRSLYDGDIYKSTGGGVSKAYSDCHVTILACTTQAIRDEILIHAQLGTRELMYDTETDMTDNDFKMNMAWENEQYEIQMKTDIQNVVCNFLRTHKVKDIEIPFKIKEFLKKESERLSILRATATIDRKHRELINPVYPEVPTRLIKQLKRIYVSLKSLDEKYPDKKCKEIIKRIVNSSGNKVRQQILAVLKKDHKKKFKISEIHKSTKIGRFSIKGQLEILWNLDVITKEVIEERIGGYWDDISQIVKGGKIEEVSYYEYKD